MGCFRVACSWHKPSRCGSTSHCYDILALSKQLVRESAGDRRRLLTSIKPNQPSEKLWNCAVLHHDRNDAKPRVHAIAVKGYRDKGSDYFDRINSEGLKRHLVKRLENLGHRVKLEPITACA